MAVDLAQVIPPLVRAKVDFILIGGMAGILHGSARVTFDVDLVYSLTSENIERLAGTLATHAPKLRDAPANLPFQWDAKTIQSGLKRKKSETVEWAVGQQAIRLRVNYGVTGALALQFKRHALTAERSQAVALSKYISEFCRSQFSVVR